MIVHKLTLPRRLSVKNQFPPAVNNHGISNYFNFACLRIGLGGQGGGMASAAVDDLTTPTNKSNTRFASKVMNNDDIIVARDTKAAKSSTLLRGARQQDENDEFDLANLPPTGKPKRLSFISFPQPEPKQNQPPVHTEKTYHMTNAAADEPKSYASNLVHKDEVI